MCLEFPSDLVLSAAERGTHYLVLFPHGRIDSTAKGEARLIVAEECRFPQIYDGRGVNFIHPKTALLAHRLFLLFRGKI